VGAARTISESASFVSAKTFASCQYECGEEVIEDKGWNHNENHGMKDKLSNRLGVDRIGVLNGKRQAKNQDLDRTFGLIRGPFNVFTEYTKKDTCLSRCQPFRAEYGNKCSRYLSGAKKVANGRDYFLCCVPQTCSYNPETSHYERHLKRQQPLVPFKDSERPQDGMCFCCTDNKTKPDTTWLAGECLQVPLFQEKLPNRLREKLPSHSGGTAARQASNSIRNAVQQVSEKWDNAVQRVSDTLDDVRKSQCESSCKQARESNTYYKKYRFGALFDSSDDGESYRGKAGQRMLEQVPEEVKRHFEKEFESSDDDESYP